MPIPFHNNEAIDEFGYAAFLHLESRDDALRGCLFFINALGEPQEFVYNRLELMSDVLWRSTDRRAAAQRRLTATLFGAATLSPLFLLARADQIPPDLFGQNGHLHLEIPVGRVAANGEKVLLDTAEVSMQMETLLQDEEKGTAEIAWMPSPPEEPLFPLLAERGLILEPFSRCMAGLHEVYEAAQA